jgi:hypothetical protein
MAEIISAEGKNLGRNASAIVITPSDDLRWVERLRDLRRRGTGGIAVVTDASTFGSETSTQLVHGALQQSGIHAYRVREGDSLQAALSQAGSDLS